MNPSIKMRTFGAQHAKINRVREDIWDDFRDGNMIGGIMYTTFLWFDEYKPYRYIIEKSCDKQILSFK